MQDLSPIISKLLEPETLSLLWMALYFLIMFLLEPNNAKKWDIVRRILETIGNTPGGFKLK